MDTGAGILPARERVMGASGPRPGSRTQATGPLANPPNVTAIFAAF